MPKYLISVDVKAAGSQGWEVEAESEEEALSIFKGGGGEVVHEELEVKSMDMTGAEVTDGPYDVSMAEGLANDV